jgi:hypothetical protein
MLMGLELPTPKALFDLFQLLTPEQQKDFLQRLGTIATAETLLQIGSRLSKPEQWRFSNAFTQQMITTLLPVLVSHAQTLVKEGQVIDSKEATDELNRRLRQTIESAAREAAILAEQQYKQQRERKPDEVRLERGKLILAAKAGGVSWKNMPAHVLETYPDWLPEYRGVVLTAVERRRLAETLRKWARDAKAARS